VRVGHLLTELLLIVRLAQGADRRANVHK
jgi:hypothetical protein